MSPRTAEDSWPKAQVPVKNWPKYEALRAKGHSKQSAARITNSQAKRKRKGRGSGK